MKNKLPTTKGALVRQHNHRLGVTPKRRTPIEIARDNPKSRAKALRAYYWDLEGCGLNAGCSGAPLKEMARDAREKYNAAKGRLKATIQQICFDCQGGGHYPLGDPGGKERVRDCEHTDCPLHPVRPWQNMKGRTKQTDEEATA